MYNQTSLNLASTLTDLRPIIETLSPDATIPFLTSRQFAQKIYQAASEISGTFNMINKNHTRVNVSGEHQHEMWATLTASNTLFYGEPVQATIREIQESFSEAVAFGLESIAFHGDGVHHPVGLVSLAEKIQVESLTPLSFLDVLNSAGMKYRSDKEALYIYVNEQTATMLLYWNELFNPKLDAFIDFTGLTSKSEALVFNGVEWVSMHPPLKSHDGKLINMPEWMPKFKVITNGQVDFATNSKVFMGIGKNVTSFFDYKLPNQFKISAYKETALWNTPATAFRLEFGAQQIVKDSSAIICVEVNTSNGDNK